MKSKLLSLQMFAEVTVYNTILKWNHKANSVLLIPFSTVYNTILKWNQKYIGVGNLKRITVYNTILKWNQNAKSNGTKPWKLFIILFWNEITRQEFEQAFKNILFILLFLNEITSRIFY